MLVTSDIADKTAAAGEGEEKQTEGADAAAQSMAAENGAAANGDGDKLSNPKQVLETLLRLRQMQKRKLEVLRKLQELARELRENAENSGD